MEMKLYYIAEYTGTRGEYNFVSGPHTLEEACTILSTKHKDCDYTAVEQTIEVE